MTPRAASTSTTVPNSVPTGGLVQYNDQGLFTKGTKNPETQLQDLTTSSFWTSSNQASLIPPPAIGSQGGNYTTAQPGCACINASSSGVASQFVGVGVYVDVNTCPVCPQAAVVSVRTQSEASSTLAAGTTQSAGVLMWTFDAGAKLRGRIVSGGDGSLYFITNDGVLHGLNSSGREILHQNAAGLAPVVMADGTVVAMSSPTELAATGADGAIKWTLTIGAGDGPIAASDSAIYAFSGGEVISVSAAGALNWRVGAGPVNAAAVTAEGIVVAGSNGAVTGIASDGAIGWAFTPAGGFSGAIATADDVVYAGSVGGALYALDARTGKQLWQVSSAHAVVAGPSISQAGTIFFGSDAIYDLSPEGVLRWSQPAVQPESAALSAVGYDSVFDAGSDGLGTMLGSDGDFIWSSRSFGNIATTTASSSGMLYVGTDTGRILAVR